MASSTCSHVASETTTNNNEGKMDYEVCTLECTVCTGFEEVAREEAMEVLGVEDVRVGRGNIIIRMPVKDATKVSRRKNKPNKRKEKTFFMSTLTTPIIIRVFCQYPFFPFVFLIVFAEFDFFIRI